MNDGSAGWRIEPQPINAGPTFFTVPPTAARFVALYGMPSSRTTRAHLPAGTVLDGRFRIGEPLGSGGMGTVYRAVQTTMGRPVAVKVLRKEIARDPMAVKRFHREAQAVSVLTHPNVVTVHDFGQLADATLYLVLELIEGRDLANLIEEQRPLPPERVVHIARQILDALEEAHSRGVYHRDLKPENILLSHHAGNIDFVKVVDFGLAKVSAEATLTKTGEVFGTPVYISPEQARGLRADHRADLYAMGVVLYEMLTGHPPFRGNSGMALLMKHMRERPPSFVEAAPQVELGAALQQTVMRALSKRPEDRFQSAAEMRDALLAGLESHGHEFATDPCATQLDDPNATDPSLSPPPEAGMAPTAELSDAESQKLRRMVAEHARDAPPAVGLESESTELVDLEAMGVKPSPKRVAAIAAGALLLLVLAVWAMSSPEAPTPTTAIVPPPTPAAPPPKKRAPVKTAPAAHTVALASTPRGAAVEVAVRSPGATADVVHRFADSPARLSVSAGSHVRATFQLAGHAPATVSWTSDGDRELVQHLIARPEPAAPRPARKARAEPVRKRAPAPPPRSAPAAPEPEEELDDLK